MKKSILLCISIILLTFVSCSKPDKVEEKAKELTNAFANGDMDVINKNIFGIDELKVDDELVDIWSENGHPKEGGVLSAIFELTTVKAGKTTDTTIQYEIKAPDMSNVFEDMDKKAEKISESEMLEYIADYAKKTGTKVTEVTLDYILVDDELIVEYRNEKFINAITGGLLDAYRTLYSEMMKEYTEGVR